MANFETKEYQPGTFCWTELCTTNTDAAMNYYSELFGWTRMDMPMPGGAEGHYTIIKNQGCDVAGAYMQCGENTNMSAPPHWSVYVSVDDVDATAKKAKELGGTIMMEPFDVPNTGRMATIVDPAGGILGIWYNKSNHKGAAQFDGATGSVCWNELISTNIDAAGKFYCNLFNWTPQMQAMGDTHYTLFMKGEWQVAGMMAKKPEMGPMPSMWVPYFTVEKCDATVSKCKTLGGKVLFPPMDLPGLGRFAWLQDPQGALHAVFEPMMKK